MRSHRCQQRHHNQCTIPPGKPGAKVSCDCKCHYSDYDNALSAVKALVDADSFGDWPSDTSKAKGTTPTGFVTYAACKHDKPTLIFDGALTVYAGSRSCPCPPGMVYLDLAGNAAPLIEVSGMPFSVLPETRPRVGINWPDMSTPSLTREHWQKIVAGIQATGLPVYVACMAGHGRTGTALAILGCLTGQIPADSDPVEWLRAGYCDDLVESNSQLDYIRQITGRTLTAKPSMASWSFNAGPKEPWIEGTPLSECKWASSGHTGCDTMGHEPKAKATPAPKASSVVATVIKGAINPAVTIVEKPSAQRCLVCHAWPQYGGHMAHCSLNPFKG